jgi:hypothetical protein
MSAGTLAPYAFPQAFDDDGDPLDGGLLFTYLAGTTTPATTYTDADLLVPNTNPIVLTAGGRFKIFLADLSYKFILQDATGVVVDTTDPVTSIGLTRGGTYDIFTFAGDSTSPITSTSYPSGATFDKCHAGTALFPLDSATLSGTYKLQGMLLSQFGDLVTVALVNLTDGAPDLPLVTITSTSLTGEVVTSAAITFPSPGATKTYGIKAKTAATSGFAWGLQLVKTT